MNRGKLIILFLFFGFSLVCFWWLCEPVCRRLMFICCGWRGRRRRGVLVFFIFFLPSFFPTVIRNFACCQLVVTSLQLKVEGQKVQWFLFFFFPVFLPNCVEHFLLFLKQRFLASVRRQRKSLPTTLVRWSFWIWVLSHMTSLIGSWSGSSPDDGFSLPFCLIIYQTSWVSSLSPPLHPHEILISGNQCFVFLPVYLPVTGGTSGGGRGVCIGSDWESWGENATSNVYVLMTCQNWEDCIFWPLR